MTTEWWNEISLQKLDATLAQEDLKWALWIRTSREIFKSLSQWSTICDYVMEHFSDIYSLEVEVWDRESYQPYPYIHTLIQQYKKRAELHPLEIMVFKYNDITLQTSRLLFEELKRKTIGNSISYQEKTYCIIIGAYWSTASRENTEMIKIIKDTLPYQKL